MGTIHDSEPMSQRQYAKRRGCSAMAVSRAVRAGRLKDSVRDGKIIDPDLADREWEANTDYTDAPASVVEKFAPKPAGPVAESDDETAGEGSSLSEANRVEKIWKARTAELRYREAAGELVNIRDASDKFVDKIISCKVKLLGIASRARQALPHLSVADVETIDRLIREALESLAADADG